MTRSISLPWLLLLTFTLLLPCSVAFADVSALAAEEEEESEDEESADDDEDLPPWAEPKDEGDKSDSGDEEADSSDEEDDGSEDSVEESEVSSSAPAASSAASGSSSSWKGGGTFGMGFVVGTDNGLSIKLWPKRMHGIHIHIAAPTRLNAVSVGFAYQLHMASIAIPGSKVQLHPSIGPSFRLRAFVYNDGAYVDGQVGASIGMSISMSQVPVELFFEVIPGFTFGINIPGVGLGFDVGGHVGARFYFGG
jgi:hypothetical protein